MSKVKGRANPMMRSHRAHNRRRELFEKLLEGQLHDDSEKEKVAKKYGVSLIQIKRDIDAMRDKMKETRTQNLPEVVNLHVERYEWMWRTLRKLEKEGMYARAALLKVMKCKERMLGWHNENFSLEVVNNVLNEVENGTETNYDFTNLVKDKKKRLRELLAKCKK